MKVINHTEYDTRALRSLICAVHGLLAKVEGKLQTWEQLRVTVVYARGSHMSGCASLAGWHMRLRVPRAAADPGALAWMIEHELLHNYGYRHRQMARGWPTGAQITARYAWARTRFGATMPRFTVPPKRTPSPKPDVQEVRYARVLASITRWATKLRRAQTALKRLGAKRRYYERAFANKQTKKGGQCDVGASTSE